MVVGVHTGFVQTAIGLVEKHFAPVEELRLEAEQDPEVDERYVVIEVATGLDAEESLLHYRNYTREWI